VKGPDSKNWFKRHKVILAIVALIIVIGLATSAVLLAASKHNTNTKTQASSQVTTDNTAVASAYKLAACKSGATQTVGNAGYVVGTDIAPGNYQVKDAFQSADAGTGWTNVDIYAKQADFKGHNDGNGIDSLQPNVGQTAHTMLKDGEYVSVWADDAVFTCV
jgi:hypothetical protein